MIDSDGVVLLVECYRGLDVLFFVFAIHSLLSLGLCHRQTCGQVEFALESLCPDIVLNEFQGNGLRSTGLNVEVCHRERRLAGGNDLYLLKGCTDDNGSSRHREGVIAGKCDNVVTALHTNSIQLIASSGSGCHLNGFALSSLTLIDTNATMLNGSNADSVAGRSWRCVVRSHLDLDISRKISIISRIRDGDARDGDRAALEGGIGREGDLQYILGICVEEQSFAVIDSDGVVCIIESNGRLDVLFFVFVPHGLLGLGFCHRQASRQVEGALEGLSPNIVLHEFQGNGLRFAGLNVEISHRKRLSKSTTHACCYH